MSSTPKKRPKPKPKPKPHASSTPPSIASVLEPSQNLFPSKDEFLRLIAVLAIATSVALTFNFLSTSLVSPQPKPFCDSNLYSLDFIPDYSCEPCPSNGRCHQGKLECLDGYKKHGKLCREDGDINETAKKLAERVEIRLCEAHAELLCHGTGTVWVQDNAIWNDLDKHEVVELGTDNAIYMYAKEKTMQTVNRMLDTRINSNGVKELKCPDLLAEHYKPFSCQIRQWISAHAIVILPVCALLLGSMFLLWKLRQRRYLSTRADEIYQEVRELLEENALTLKRVNSESEPWVVSSRLRDHLLSPKERKDPVLWKKVEEFVQEDSCIDQYPKVVNGDPKVVWEWQVEGSLSSSRTIKKGEANKSKSSKGMGRSSNQHIYSFKTEPKTLNYDTRC